MRLVRCLRSGAWLTPDRLRVYPALILGAFVLATIALGATAHGLVDAFGRPLGADFSGVWVAGREALAGAPTRPFDLAAHAAAQAAAFGVPDNFLPWPYPPIFLAVAAALACLPYLAALTLWEGATAALYLLAVRLAARGAPIAPRDLLVAALAFPAAGLNAMHGQNGFLSAALLGFGALLAPRRPLAAGFALGLLAYKPHFAILWPLALLAARAWRTLGAAIASVAALIAITIFVFGIAPWSAFVHGLPFMRIVVLEGGGLDSAKLVSAFAAVRLVGGSLACAYALQGLVAVGAAAALVWIWARPTGVRPKAAALALASLLATPYGVDYDLVILGPALAALCAEGVEHGFMPFEKSLLAVAWIVPLVSRGAATTLHLPLAVIVLVALMMQTVRRARVSAGGRTDTAGMPATEPAPSVERHTPLSNV